MGLFSRNNGMHNGDIVPLLEGRYENDEAVSLSRTLVMLPFI